MTYDEWIERYLTEVTVTVYIHPTNDTDYLRNLWSFRAGNFRTFEVLWHNPASNPPLKAREVLDSLCGDISAIDMACGDINHWPHGFEDPVEAGQAFALATATRVRVHYALGDEAFNALMEAVE